MPYFHLSLLYSMFSLHSIYQVLSIWANALICPHQSYSQSTLQLLIVLEHVRVHYSPLISEGVWLYCIDLFLEYPVFYLLLRSSVEGRGMSLSKSTSATVQPVRRRSCLVALNSKMQASRTADMLVEIINYFIL